MFPCHLQRMPSSNMIIYVEFSVLHWHFDLVLKASVMTVHAAIRVYMFHGHQFCSPVMSPFLCLHESYEDVALDDVRPPFHSLMYLINGESNLDTRLTLTYSIDSDRSELTYPSVIHLTSYLSSSTASQAPLPRHRHGFIYTHAIPRDYGQAQG